MLVAQAPDSEPKLDLEKIAVNIMTKAFQVADYDTVEVLFGKLSVENKKTFLQEAVGMTMMMSDMSETSMPRTLMDTAFFALMMNEPAKQHETIERWSAQKSKQTQLLGRLTLSLFEQAAVEKPQVAKEEKRIYYVEDIMEHLGLKNVAEIIDIITAVIEPTSWKWTKDDASFDVNYGTQSLAVRQTAEVHAQIEDLLNQMREKVAIKGQTVVR